MFITITGREDGLKQAQYIMANIVKSNMHKLNLVSNLATASSTTSTAAADKEDK